MKDRVVVFGGLGNPSYSVISLYAPFLIKLGSENDLIAIDTVDTQRDQISELKKT